MSGQSRFGMKFRDVKGVALRFLAIRDNVEYGENLHVGPGSVIWASERLQIGRDVYVGKNVTIQADGWIGDGTMIANNVGIVGRRDHDIKQVGVPISSASWVGETPRLRLNTVIGGDCWLGFGSIVLSGVTIGNSTVIAAGSVVWDDIPANSIVSGNPAKRVRSRFTHDDYLQHVDVLEGSGVRLMPTKGGRIGG